jgi:nucleoside-triphosphatase
MDQAFLLTGVPGSGKTSLLKEVLAQVSASAGGFYTEEIRFGGARHGFKIVTLDGQSATLAHIDIQSPYRVSKYGVDLAALEQVAVPAITKAIGECDIVVIDEIGKMELFSRSFREAVLEAIASGKRVLGTIMLKPHPWADRIKQHPGVKVVPVTKMNRSQVMDQVLLWLKS